jgi:hypothetical protein
LTPGPRAYCRPPLLLNTPAGSPLPHATQAHDWPTPEQVNTAGARAITGRPQLAPRLHDESNPLPNLCAR